jgi:hypothetical protein
MQAFPHPECYESLPPPKGTYSARYRSQLHRFFASLRVRNVLLTRLPAYPLTRLPAYPYTATPIRSPDWAFPRISAASRMA